ncbi:MAG: hypothetical protein O7G84_04550, partial [Gammaproteobacteria bacterium]|nr:hypothetical protein [Gammaproteobacteria bacterium]
HKSLRQCVTGSDAIDDFIVDAVWFGFVYAPEDHHCPSVFVEGTFGSESEGRAGHGADGYQSGQNLTGYSYHFNFLSVPNGAPLGAATALFLWSLSDGNGAARRQPDQVCGTPVLAA